VFSIWEGTTNVLSLDFLRALKKEPGAAEWFQQKAQDLLKWPGNFQTEYHQKRLKQILEISQKNPEKLEAYARDLSLSFGFLYASHLEI
jgi:hypothetical protein